MHVEHDGHRSHDDPRGAGRREPQQTARATRVAAAVDTAAPGVARAARRLGGADEHRDVSGVGRVVRVAVAGAVGAGVSVGGGSGVAAVGVAERVSVAVGVAVGVRVSVERHERERLVVQVGVAVRPRARRREQRVLIERLLPLHVHLRADALLGSARLTRETRRAGSEPLLYSFGTRSSTTSRLASSRPDWKRSEQ